MTSTYLFFRPSRLPLQADELDASTVHNLDDGDALRTALRASFPDLEISADGVARASAEGRWLEFVLPGKAGATLVMHGSLRDGHGDVVQRLCDRWGWLATDARPHCFQPQRAPMRV